MSSLKAIINIILGKPVVANVRFDQNTKITLEKDYNRGLTITGCHFAAQPCDYSLGRLRKEGRYDKLEVWKKLPST